MKVVILAGGLGTRLSEETYLKPKPMVEIGQMPIIWHIMKHYSSFGLSDFIICAGYKDYVIKEFFANYSHYRSNMKIDLKHSLIETENDQVEPWTVTIVNTGLDSNTGERLRRIRDHIAPNEDFCFTYGDGLSDVNIKELIEFHSNHKKLVSMTVIRPLSRYGSVELKGNSVTQFQEKPESQSFVNGGFFILNEQVFSLICPENPSWENDLLPLLVRQSEVHAYKHLGFWQSMDTLRDKNLLEQMWNSGNPPWKSWND